MRSFKGGKIGRFDPKTETFKEWTLPGSKPGPYPDDENGPYPIGSDPGPYGFVLDKNQHAWYAGVSTDTVGGVNPKTGKVTVSVHTLGTYCSGVIRRCAGPYLVWIR